MQHALSDEFDKMTKWHNQVVECVGITKMTNTGDSGDEDRNPISSCSYASELS